MMEEQFPILLIKLKNEKLLFMEMVLKQDLSVILMILLKGYIKLMNSNI